MITPAHVANPSLSERFALVQLHPVSGSQAETLTQRAVRSVSPLDLSGSRAAHLLTSPRPHSTEGEA